MKLKNILPLVFGLVLGTSVAFAQDATVRVVHGIDGRDLGAAKELPVDVEVNNGCLLQGFEFRDVAGPLMLPAGTYNVVISLANASNPCSNPAVITAPVPIAAGENVVIIAHLDDSGNPTASKFVIDDSRPRFFKTRLVLHHTAWAPAVDVKIRRLFRSTLVENVVNGAQASLDALFGFFKISVFAANSTTRVLGPLWLFEWHRVTALFVVGSLTNDTLGVIKVRIR